MIQEITPLVQVAGTRVWLRAVSAHIVGATVSGALLGLVLSTFGLAIRFERWVPVGLLGGVILIACAARDAGLGRWGLPSLSRQTPRWFKRQFAPVHYGLLWGADLGQGWTTHILFAGYYGLVVVALLWGDPTAGTLTMAGYGFGRALPVLVAGLLERSHPGQTLSTSPAFRQAFLLQANAVALAVVGSCVAVRALG